MSEETKCPKCGSNSGYATFSRCTLVSYFDFGGEVYDSEITRDNLRTGQIKRCIDCKKDITKFIKDTQ